MKPAGDPMALPARLRLRAARGSALAMGLGQAQARVPTDEQLRALERNVLAALGATGAASILTAAARTARTGTIAHSAAGFSIGAAKIVIALALVAGAGTGFWIGRRPAPVIAPAIVPVPTTSVSPAAIAPPEPAVIALQPARPRAPATGHIRRAITSTAATGARAPASNDGESEELRLLARAQKALTLDPPFALTLAHEHQRRYPSGSMDQEREVIAVSALVKLGRTAEARERAERFSRDHAGSAYAARMQSILAGAAAQP
jgi:hypothetical protein